MVGGLHAKKAFFYKGFPCKVCVIIKADAQGPMLPPHNDHYLVPGMAAGGADHRPGNFQSHLGRSST